MRFKGIHFFLSLLLIWAAVFGLFMINHESGAMHTKCFAAQMQGVTCPGDKGNPVTFSLFHLKAFKIISTATFKPFYAVNFFAVMIFALIGFAIFFASVFYELGVCANMRARKKIYLASFGGQYVKQFVYWFSLHENSPALVMAAV